LGYTQALLKVPLLFSFLVITSLNAFNAFFLVTVFKSNFLDLPVLDLTNSEISGDYSGFSATDVFDYDPTNTLNSYMFDVPNLLYGDLD